MKPLKMNWAKTPYIRNGSCGWEALVSFDCFVPKEVFEVVKSTFEGYIQKNGKKVALYNLGVIGDLVEAGHQIELDGVNIGNNTRSEDILSISENSTNDKVAYLSQFYNRMMKYKEKKEEFNKQLDDFFGKKYFRALSQGVEIPKDIKWEYFNIGGQEIHVDFKYGVQKGLTWEEPSHEYFVGVDVFRLIPSKEKLPELREFLEESKKFPKDPNPNINDEWQPGFNEQTYEPKKKMGYRR
jgi:hypothetical protein